LKPKRKAVQSRISRDDARRLPIRARARDKSRKNSR
jgi:propanediol utilization protein